MVGKRHVVCYSGGHSSGLVAIEVSRRYQGSEIILLNHDLPSWTEDKDIKRFKKEVADYLKLPITFASYKDGHKDQFDVYGCKSI